MPLSLLLSWTQAAMDAKISIHMHVNNMKHEITPCVHMPCNQACNLVQNTSCMQVTCINKATPQHIANHDPCMQLPKQDMHEACKVQIKLTQCMNHMQQKMQARVKKNNLHNNMPGSGHACMHACIAFMQLQSQHIMPRTLSSACHASHAKDKNINQK